MARREEQIELNRRRTGNLHARGPQRRLQIVHTRRLLIAPGLSARPAAQRRQPEHLRREAGIALD